MSNNAAEFANKVKDQKRKKTEKNVERCRFWRRAFNNLVNVHGCNVKCGYIHGKEIPGQSKFHHEFQGSHLEEKIDITAKLVGEQEEINNVDKIH